MEHDIMTQEVDGTTDPTVPEADQESGDMSGSDASEAGFSDTDVEASEQAGEGAEGTEPSEATDEDTDAQPSVQPTADQNAANAERRREAERRRAEERERIRRDTIMEVTGGINPYTQEPMKDGRDVEEYLEMREIERRGGEPVAEYAKYHKQIERERADAAQIQEQRLRVAEDRAAFVLSHPDVDLSSLMREDAFVNYAADKLGKQSLNDVYDGYMRKQTEAKAAEDAKIEARARELAAQMVANASASPGSAVGAPQASSEAFTPERVRSMSREEVHANYDKIIKSMKYWN